MKKVYLFLFLFCACWQAFATELDSAAVYQQQLDSINATFTYQRGKVVLQNGLAQINVPQGFKFLDADQSARVITELWGNPGSLGTMGMLFPENDGPANPGGYAVNISYSDEGFVKDDDAGKIDYKELLGQMQDDLEEENEARAEEGYPRVELVGWATAPFYDKASHKLHWAKELKFEGADANTLNYNIRILGRKGYLMLNVISDMDMLPAVQKEIPQLLASVEFKEGSRYTDFDPGMDKVAAYGIGGLIAGKILAKAGFFALILKFLKPLLLLLAKFWKVIAMALAGGVMWLRKFLSGRKAELALAEATTEPAELPEQPLQ